MISIDQKRIIFYVFLSIAFIVLIFKLAQLQIFEKTKYLHHSQRNRIRRVVLQPTRGVIYDRFGAVLVDNSPSYSVSAIPFHCVGKDSLVHDLAELLNEPFIDVNEKLIHAPGRFLPVKLKRDVKFETLIALEERKLDLPGVMYDIDPKRNYPAGIKAPHVFGYLGEISRSELQSRPDEDIQPGDIVGKRGLERVYDQVLRGHMGYDYYEVDALGREIRDLKLEEERSPQPGNDIYLTLDASLQLLAEKLFAGKKGGLVMINLKDGGILADCSKPDYDPLIFSTVVTSKMWRKLVNDPDKPLYDRMIQSSYPPGSTFKLVLAAAALEEHICKPGRTTVCKGYVKLGRRVFKCWKAGGHGEVDLLGAIKASCNTYFYRLSLDVGLDNWSEYAKKFGFGQSTNVDLLGENHGNLPDRAYLDKMYGKNKWSKGILLNLAIGQGELLVTPLQMAQFAMILAKSGSYFQPHLVDRVFDAESGSVRRFQPKYKKVQGISQATFDILRQGMYQVVNAAGGTGRASYMPHVVAAGKTGTAENPHGDSHAWFIGFAPFENPQVAICVFVENGGGGGANAAPIAGNLLRKYFSDFKPRVIAKKTQ